MKNKVKFIKRNFDSFKRILDRNNFKNDDMILINGLYLIQYKNIDKNIANIVHFHARTFKKMRILKNNYSLITFKDKKIYTSFSEPHYYTIFQKVRIKGILLLKATETHKLK